MISILLVKMVEFCVGELDLIPKTFHIQVEPPHEITSYIGGRGKKEREDRSGKIT